MTKSAGSALQLGRPSPNGVFRIRSLTFPGGAEHLAGCSPFALNLALFWHRRLAGDPWVGRCISIDSPFWKELMNHDVDFERPLWLSCNKIYTEQRDSAIFQGQEGAISSVSALEREQGNAFLPKFGSDGLLTAVVVDSGDGTVLMVGHMNRDAIDATLETRVAHFYSRSRQRLWKKGETSGNILNVEEVLVDCDQDALVLRVRAAGPTCHTGQRSCFYRSMHMEDKSLLNVNS